MIATLSSVPKRALFCGVTSLLLFAIQSCQNNGSSGQVGVTPKKETASTVTVAPLSYKPTYNLYVETSGSMTGYITRPTEFKNTVSSLLTDVKTKDLAGTININFISGRVCQVGPNAGSNEIDYFIKNLNPALISKANCGSGSSDLPQIFKQVTKNNDSSVNVIVSDCIFSLKGQNAVDYLEAYQNSMTLFFSDSLKKKPFSTLILKYESDFNGTYYNESTPKTNPDLTGKGIKRPFYAILIGNSQFINDFVKNIKYTGYDGYQASYLLQPPATQSISAKVLRTPRKGDYAIKMPASSLQIENATLGGRTGQPQSFQFSIAANLSSFAFGKDYLTAISNYTVPSNYKIDSISLIDSTKSSELNGYTHLFTLSTTDLRQNQDVTISLQNNIPAWVEASSTIDDSNILDPGQQKKTFGFQYLVKGIAGAYDNRFNTNSQFNITVKVSKGEGGANTGTSGFNWWLLIGAFVLVGIIIWVKNKK